MAVFTRKASASTEAEAPPFETGGVLLPDGGVRYKILCDGGIRPSGVFWDQTVPAGAIQLEYEQAKATMAAKVEELKALGG